MKKNLKQRALEIAEFIFYNIILGVAGWLVISCSIKYQQEFTISNGGNRLYYLLLSVAPFMIYVWLLFTTDKRNKWNISYENINFISRVIVALTIIVLSGIFGIAEIFV